MRFHIIAGILIASIFLAGSTSIWANQESRLKTWSFDSDAINAAPSGFEFKRTGKGSPGRWIVLAEKDAPSSPNVLAQVDTDNTDNRFPIAVANEPSLSDLRLSARCKPVSGRVDQACGLVFRYQDENNYYVTRANALEGNVRLYYVKDGRRHQIASWDGKVTKGIWHEIRIEARGDHLEIYWDGKKIIDAHDTTFRDAGKIGVWTKADSVTYFDDLSLEPLGP
ncbi:MAG: hypothetical protein HZA13_04655 [Nitrospirae bacterium]|nr:hypothetical protein [Nitrospirota bacterium]